MLRNASTTLRLNIPFHNLLYCFALNVQYFKMTMNVPNEIMNFYMRMRAFVYISSLKNVQ